MDAKGMTEDVFHERGKSPFSIGIKQAVLECKAPLHAVTYTICRCTCCRVFLDFQSDLQFFLYTLAVSTVCYAT